MSQREQRGGVLLLLLLVGLVSVFALSCSGPPRASTRDVGNIYGSYAAARQFIERRLAKPATAKWPAIRQVSVQPANGWGDRWRVATYVDSQNRSGVMIRTTWAAEVKYHGRDEWTLVSLARTGPACHPPRTY